MHSTLSCICSGPQRRSTSFSMQQASMYRQLNSCAKQGHLGIVVQVSGRIWEHVVASLHALKEPPALIAWLPSDQPDGKAGAAAALLGNLAQVSASALQVNSRLCTWQHPCTAHGNHAFLCELGLFCAAHGTHACQVGKCSAAAQVCLSLSKGGCVLHTHKDTMQVHLLPYLLLSRSCLLCRRPANAVRRQAS